MSFEVRGVVAGSRGSAVSIETVVVPDPGAGEALVAIEACGSATPISITGRVPSATNSLICSATRRPG